MNNNTDNITNNANDFAEQFQPAPKPLENLAREVVADKREFTQTDLDELLAHIACEAECDALVVNGLMAMFQTFLDALETDNATIIEDYCHSALRHLFTFSHHHERAYSIVAKDSIRFYKETDFHYQTGNASEKLSESVERCFPTPQIDYSQIEQRVTSLLITPTTPEPIKDAIKQVLETNPELARLNESINSMLKC